MKKLNLLIWISILFLSCSNPEAPEASLSVEAYIYEAQPINHIKLSLVKPINETERQPVSDAEVFIQWNNKYYQLKEIIDEPGTFYSDNINLQIIENNTYTLIVRYHDEEYLAETIVPSIPKQLEANKDTIDLSNNNDLITITWQNSDSTWYLGVIAPEEGSSTEFPFNNFFSLPTKESSIKIETEDVNNTGSQHFVLYGITEDYAKLYRISSSSIGATNVGNLSNGFGIFAAFSSDTLTFVAKSP